MASEKLHYNTVTPTLKKILHLLMDEPIFNPFRLVGGTNLSLRLGTESPLTLTLSKITTTDISHQQPYPSGLHCIRN